MKTVVLVVLAVFAASIQADDEWVSVGAAAPVAPADPASTIDTSSRAVVQSSAKISPDSPSSDLLSEMYVQSEQMQQEIATLRGQVEAQNHQIQQMKQEQQERYLDLDRRISTLMSASGNHSVPTGSVSLSPSDAYKNAQKLMYDKKYIEANTAYEAFTQQYPGDPLAVNAIYWSGEIYLLQGNLDKALSNFLTVVNQHKGHLKVPDAMYKVGYTLDKQGKVNEAKGWMKKVVDQYQGKSDTVVRLAKNYLEAH